MVSVGKYFVTGEFRVVDDSKGMPFPGAHVEVVLACDYEALVRRHQDLQEDRQHTAGERDALAQRCRELKSEIEQYRKDVSDARMWSDESIDAAINKSP